MNELTVNLHMHTIFSDGSGNHVDLAKAALKSGVDVLLVTDHNVLIQGVDGYHRDGKRKVLLISCEEIHDQDRDPQKNHLLVFGTNRELAPLADDPQVLINTVHSTGGICFIAHPVDPPLSAFGEGDISWVDWNVVGYTGIELWNGFSELKSVVKGKLGGLFFAFFPEFIARGPLPETLSIWDRKLAEGQNVVAIGGSDAHARRMSLGPIHRLIFPYEYHFSAINTHILTPNPLIGEIEEDKKLIFSALASGNCFVGYDLPASTHGFRFSAHSREQTVIMGEEIRLNGGINLQVKLPSKAEIRLIKDGKNIQVRFSEILTYTTREVGVFRVEVYRHFLGRRRGWIFSNPIYVRD